MCSQNEIREDKQLPKIMYICGARSFFSSSPIRKIAEVVSCFRLYSDVMFISGGDFVKNGKVSSFAKTIINPKRKSRSWLVDFVVNTVSEIRDLWNDRKIYRFLLKQEEPVCVVERSSRFCYAGMRYSRKKCIPYVLEWKDNVINYRFSLFKFWARRVEKKKLACADCIFVESKVIKDLLVKEGVDSSRIVVTYNAVNPDEFVRNDDDRMAIRSEYNFRASDIVIGYVGTYAFYHDSIRMILAAEELRKRGFSQVKWLLIGNGKDYEMCRITAEKCGLLDDCIYMIPGVPKEQVPRYLSAVDMTILPGSTDLICPIKVMEYMSSQTVVLAPDYPCNREVLTEDCGAFFEPFSEVSIANQIISLLKQPENIKILGESARKIVTDNFVWEKTYGLALKRVLEKFLA